MPPRAVLLGIPYDAGSSYLRGPAAAPAAIRRALVSPSSNSFSEALRDVSLGSGLEDAGDLDLSGGEPRAIIERGARDLIETGQPPLFLGGDHSVSYPVLRAVGSAISGLTVVHIDAHADLYDDFEGDRYSHACPFARVMEDGLADRLVQVGVRTLMNTSGGRRIGSGWR